MQRKHTTKETFEQTPYEQNFFIKLKYEDGKVVHVKETSWSTTEKHEKEAAVQKSKSVFSKATLKPPEIFSHSSELLEHYSYIWQNSFL